MRDTAVPDGVYGRKKLVKKAIIAMSGGVDSSVAALLTVRAGYSCIGATMKLFTNDDAGVSRENSCCSLDDVEDARSVAYSLGMEHYVFNFADRFRETVIDPFVAAYETGRTPNPCIECNRCLKFDTLFRRMEELSYDFVVTGHYARIEQSGGRFLLKKAADASKDQSYVLYAMTQKQLSHTLFPLGGLNKTEVREIAEKHGFVNAHKHDSQDICFVQSGSYVDFIRQYTGREYPPGDFVDADGNVLGRHRGIIRYTVGQHKGLGIPSAVPLYVREIRPEDNTVVLGREEELYTSSLTARGVNWIAWDRLDAPARVTARIRYRQKEQPATVRQTGEDEIRVEFDEPQRAVTRGQAVVLYDGELVLGGATIV